MSRSKFNIRGVLFPPEFDEGVIEETDHVIFLAGPIRDAPNWQQEALDFMLDNYHNPHGDINVVIACPRWPGEKMCEPEVFDFQSQVDWETEYLARAAIKGTVLFWLPNPADKLTKNRCYGQTSRFELGEWLTAACLGWQGNAYPVGLALGIEPGFSGEQYIRARAAALLPGLDIYTNLEQTCMYALALVEHNPRFKSNEA